MDTCYFSHGLKDYHINEQEIQNIHITVSLRREKRNKSRSIYFFAWIASERSKNSIATRPSTELSAYPA